MGAEEAVHRERARMRAAVHDGPLQLVLAAHQDLQSVAAGDADALEYAQRALEQAAAELRRLAVDCGPVSCWTPRDCRRS